MNNTVVKQMIINMFLIVRMIMTKVSILQFQPQIYF
jgi:hypothetical protein